MIEGIKESAHLTLMFHGNILESESIKISTYLESLF